jgi:hypothetical protein
MASSRLAFAITISGAIIWVYGLTVLVLNIGKPIFPVRGVSIILILLSSFLGSLYLLFFYFISPYLAMEMTFTIILVPLSCAGSGICRRVAAMEPEDAVSRAILEALVLGGVIIALALIREPLGFGSLSFPGGSEGIMEILFVKQSPYFPVRIISTAAGGLLLLGYGLALFRRIRVRFSREDKQ